MKGKIYVILLLALVIEACGKKQEVFYAQYQPITQSVYASGVVLGKNQYEVFAKVPGLLEEIYVSEGDTIVKGQKLFRVSNASAQFNRENAEAAAVYNDDVKNQDKLVELGYALSVQKQKCENDSLLWLRQKNLWGQQVGTKLELEQKELNYKNSLANYESSLIKYKQLQRQITFSGKQAKVNLALSNAQLNDLMVLSEINGIVYDVLKQKGEMVSLQLPLAIAGDGKDFYVEMQVDEFDISQVKLGQTVYVSMDSQKGKVFEARVSKIRPIMNGRTKSFVVEAAFVQTPDAIYPNLTAEANIVIQKKEKALLIPRNLLMEGNKVKLENGEQRAVTVGLMDYEQAEILSGITETDKLVKPE